jgi:hypothetical protein
MSFTRETFPRMRQEAVLRKYGVWSFHWEGHLCHSLAHSHGV